MTGARGRSLHIRRNDHLILALDFLDEGRKLSRGTNSGQLGVWRNCHFCLERNVILTNVEPRAR